MYICQYFVMRYFDEKEIFNSLRFQIDLGTYYKDVYPKTLKDGYKMENRYLSKHLKGFGMLLLFSSVGQNLIFLH